MNNFKNFIFGSKKRLAILILAVAALGIPLTVTLVGQRQDIRQRAQEICFPDPVTGKEICWLTPTGSPIPTIFCPRGSYCPTPTGSPIPTIFCPRGSYCPTPTGSPTPTPTPTPTQGCVLHSRGDANCDGKVNTDDFNIWRDEFLEVLSSKSSDFNPDGVINTDDFNIWRDGFLNPEVPH